MKPSDCRMKAAHSMECVESMCGNCPYQEERVRSDRLARTVEAMLESKMGASGADTGTQGNAKGKA